MPARANRAIVGDVLTVFYIAAALTLTGMVAHLPLGVSNYRVIRHGAKHSDLALFVHAKCKLLGWWWSIVACGAGLFAHPHPPTWIAAMMLGVAASGSLMRFHLLLED